MAIPPSASHEIKGWVGVGIKLPLARLILATVFPLASKLQCRLQSARIIR